MIKAYGMVHLYCKYVTDDLKKQEVESSPEIIKTVRNFVRTTIQIYKILLQTQSIVLALTEYDKELNKIFEQIDKDKAVILNELNNEIDHLNKKLKQLEGIEKEMLRDEIVWKEKTAEEIKIEMELNNGRGHSVDEYNRIYTDLREKQYDIRKVLFVIYKDVKQHVGNNKEIDLNVMHKMLTTLDIVTNIVKNFVGSETKNLEGI